MLKAVGYAASFLMRSCIFNKNALIVINLQEKNHLNCKHFYLVRSISSSSSNMDSAGELTTFNEKSDIYQGIAVNTHGFSFSNEKFEAYLMKYLSEWSVQGKRGIWFQVDINTSSYIPILVKNGFIFHHAKKSYVMLTKWLPKENPDLLPEYPSTHIGVGGFVVNDKNQVLVIQEKYHKKRHWKLPGGYSKPGESLEDTACREVFEETGIKTEIVSLVSLRQQHKYIFDCSDIYFVCHLRPLTTEIDRNGEEIACCEWMDLETYHNHTDVSDFNRAVVDAYLQSQKLKAAILPSKVLSFMKDCYHDIYAVRSTVEDSTQTQS